MENNINNNSDSKNLGVDREKKEVKRVIKTYRDYAVNALDSNPTSLANMIIQEKNKRAQREEKSIQNPKNIFMIIISSILVILGISAIAVVIIFVDKSGTDSSEKRIISHVKSTIEYDYKKSFELDDLSSVKKASSDAFDNTNLPFGSIKNIFFTKKDELGYSRQVDAKEFIESLDSRVPNQFIRNLNGVFSAGVVSLEGNKPFLILETVNFDASYSNMLAWEKTMLYDIGSLFRVNQKHYATKFEDIILNNRDVRAILDSEGNLVFAYSFVESHKIVFFTDNHVLKILLNNMKNIVKK